MFGGWQGIMSRKRPYTGIDWSGYVPQMNTPMADPGLAAANARVASGTTIPQTSMAGKKGLSMKNMINAMSKLKSPTGMDFGRSGGRVGGSRPTTPSPRALGVDALEMASADDPRKKWWKQWQGLMGA